MAITLRSGRELKEREENEKEMVEIDKYAEIREETRQYSSNVIEEERTVKVQQE